MSPDPKDLTIIRFILWTLFIGIFAFLLYYIWEDHNDLPCWSKDKNGRILVICDPPRPFPYPHYRISI